jgi:hypothetical protein
MPRVSIALQPGVAQILAINQVEGIEKVCHEKF